MSEIDVGTDLGFNKVSSGRFSFDVTPAFHLLTVPKSFTGVRPGVVIDPASKLVYTAAASQLAKRLHGDLPDWVYGWRLRNGEPSNTTEERLFYDESVGVVRKARWALQTDITSFFASTDIDTLTGDIRSKVGRTAATDAVEEILDAHRQLSERRGLPQRCYASSYLANLAVSHVDDTIMAALSEGRVSSVRRWMDDISLESEKLQDVYRLIIDIQAAMRRAGLEINTAKTHLTDGKKSHALLKTESPDQLELKSLLLPDYTVEADFEDEPRLDLKPLEQAEQRLLKNPKGIGRGEGAMILKALRSHNMTDRYLEWRNIAHQLPHIADTLGRYFAVAIRNNRGAKSALEKWFVKFEESEWSSVDWVAPQYAMAFSSDNLPPSMTKILHAWLAQSQSLQQVSLAAQRLSASDPPAARAILAKRSNTESDPHIQRALALGMVAAEASQQDVKRLLGRSGIHRLTLKALESRKWRLPKSSHDFDPVSVV
ncbi:RNA-directed DNA polymerase [Arthrobacter sp. R3-55]